MSIQASVTQLNNCQRSVKYDEIVKIVERPADHNPPRTEHVFKTIADVRNVLSFSGELSSEIMTMKAEYKKARDKVFQQLRAEADANDSDVLFLGRTYHMIFQPKRSLQSPAYAGVWVHYALVPKGYKEGDGFNLGHILAMDDWADAELTELSKLLVSEGGRTGRVEAFLAQKHAEESAG